MSRYRYTASHANPQGPGDARPTALQVVEDEGLIGKLTGKRELSTHAAGATLYLTARDAVKAQQAVDKVKNGPGPKSDAPVHGIELRLDSLASVRAAAKAFHEKSDKLNLLILNAGVMATPEGRTEDGFETQFGTNHLGHFLLFQLLKPDLLAASTPEFQSRDPYDPWASYGQSKTATIYLAKEIERRYGSKGLHAIPVHPGIVATNLSQYLSQEIVEGMLKDETRHKTIKSEPQGAAAAVYAGLSREWEGRGGKYLSNLVDEGPADTTRDWLNNEVGYAPWIYDEESASKLWKASNELVGFKSE
ncbi:hypothetical protein V496_02940 [Pseudogymnoascus sp. VKM F-4515 (FW-2607)]|nr:hypothetical protein V496_02940 [Pseudogymnoascus sp. VKM F-4515 (FW-2607)]KFY95843.1 hypothetical protein V498_03098 [Pseudogymnoascus sp. VKM F-4517 (FW-2822)]